MSKVHKLFLGLFCIGIVNTPLFADVSSVSASLTGPATINEGSYGNFLYSWVILHDTPAQDASIDLSWDFGDGIIQSAYASSDPIGATGKSHRYADNGSFTVQVTPERDFNLYSSGYSFSRGEYYYYPYGTAPAPGVKTLSINVLNVAPTINELTSNSTVLAGSSFGFEGVATDPGVNDLLSYSWDLDNDGDYDDATGSSGLHSFSEEGLYSVGLRVSDGDGGFDYDSFEVSVIPEPGVMAMMGVFAVGLWGCRRIFSM